MHEIHTAYIQYTHAQSVCVGGVAGKSIFISGNSTSDVGYEAGSFLLDLGASAVKRLT